MRWTIALNVVATLASLISVEAQETTTFHDKETGFTFSQFAAQYAIGKYIYFRIAVPSPIPVNSSYDAVLQVVAPIDVTGWTGLAWGGQMVADPLTVAWQNGNNVVFSSRYATAHVMPTTYTGATYTAFKTGTHVNRTHWQFTAKCSGCTSFAASTASANTRNNKILDPRGSNPLAMAWSATKPSNPSSASSSFSAHDVTANWMHDFATAGNVQFASLVAANTGH